MAKPAAIEIPADEPEGRLSQVIRRVAKDGERVVLSRDGQDQVAVVPVSDLDRLAQFERMLEAQRQRAAEVIEALRASSVTTGANKLTDEEIDAEIAEVRRNRLRR